MCGILGSIGLNITQQTLDSLHHRGPDGQGIEKIVTRNKAVWLAHINRSISIFSKIIM